MKTKDFIANKILSLIIKPITIYSIQSALICVILYVCMYVSHTINLNNEYLKQQNVSAENADCSKIEDVVRCSRLYMSYMIF